MRHFEGISAVFTNLLHQLQPSMFLQHKHFPIQVEAYNRTTNSGDVVSLAISIEDEDYCFSRANEAFRTLQALRDGIAEEAGLNRLPHTGDRNDRWLKESGGEYNPQSSASGGISAIIQYLARDAQRVVRAVEKLRERAGNGENIAGLDQSTSQGAVSVLDAILAALQPVHIVVNEQPFDAAISVSLLDANAEKIDSPAIMRLKIEAPSIDWEEPASKEGKAKVFGEMLEAIASEAEIPPQTPQGNRTIAMNTVCAPQATLQFDSSVLPRIVEAIEALQTRAAETVAGVGSTFANVARISERRGQHSGRSLGPRTKPEPRPSWTPDEVSK